jgi:hypothetical protein
MTSPPAVNPVGTVTALAPLFVDHSDLGIFSQAVNATMQTSPGARQLAGQMFWSTDARPADSPVQETLEISLSSTRLVNWIKFDISIFPTLMAIQYYDAASNNWLPLLDQFGQPYQQMIMRSIPVQLPNPVNVPGHLHPQHSFVGHWRSVSQRLKPTYLQRLRFVLQRLNNGLGPVSPLGDQVPYSLALRSITFGYEVATRADVPRTLPVDDTYNQSFASTDDLLGSAIAFSLRDPVVNRIVDNTDTDADAIWVCEPQPYPGAVVCFYADLRDATGNPQLIDQIYINPVSSGAHVTVYVSNDLTVGGFDSPTTPLDITQVQTVGTTPVTIQYGRLLHFGQYGEQAALAITNVPLDVNDPAMRHKAVLGYDPTLPWWFGVTVSPGFDQGVDTAEHPIFDCGVWRLSLTADGVTLIFADGDAHICPITYQGLQDTSVVVSYDGEGTFHMHARNSSDDQTDDFWVVPLQPTPSPVVTLGTDVGMEYFLNSDLTYMVLKEELADGSDGYLDNPGSYCTVAQFSGNDTPQSHNALLRLDLSATTLIDATHPWGLFGGPSAQYENLVWSPVPRDFVMTRGWMYLPPTEARFVKLEITNLQAVPYDVAVVGPQQVKTFPPQVLDAYRDQLINTASVVPPLGAATQISLSGTVPYELPVFVSTGGNGDRGYTNTEVYISDDYSAQERLRALNASVWNYQTWHVGIRAPRFTSAQVHRYTQETITRTGKVAYQCGLRQISFAYSSFTSQQDTGMYEETFYSDRNINNDPNQTNIVYDPDLDALYSGDTTTKASATSLVYTSLRDVRAVQFAVQQSQPVQLLPDDEFEDPSYSNWTLLGDVAPPQEGIVTSPVFGSLLPIDRQLVGGFWADIEPVYHTWGGITDQGKLYSDLGSNVPKSDETYGGVASAPVTQPAGGRLYAAARVVSDQDLSSPLSLQIMDSVTGQPLAEKSINVKANQVTEWYVGYTVGEGGETTANTWGDLTGAYLNNFPSFSDSFQRADSTSLGLMDSGQQWQSPASSAGSLAIVNKIAVCNVAGQVSWVDTQTPWGTLSVVLGNSFTTGTASASVPLLYLGHYRLMNDGRVVDSNTGRVVATTAGIATGDSLQATFLPTALLSSPPGGVDPTVQSWSFTLSRNGTQVATLSSAHGIGTMRGLAGAVGQQFTSFSWVPRAAAVPAGTVIPAQPMPTDGAEDPSGLQWVQANGQVWSTPQSPMQSPPVPPTWGSLPAWQGGANTITAPAFPSGDTPAIVMVSTDTGNQYGTFIFRITQLAATIAANTYSIAVLDQPNANTQLQLQANGDLVQVVSGTVTTVKAGVIPAASMTTGDIAIKYAKTSQLSTAFKTAQGISNSSAQSMIFMVDDTVVGTYSGNNIFSQSIRGLFGYNDNAGHYTITTGFGWFTDANGVTTSSGDETWDDVSAHESRTWGDLSMNISEDNPNPVFVQVIQENASVDSWYMDTLSLFSDPIVWEFSNNGGKSWVPGYDVANNPEGAVAFNPKNPNDLAAVSNQLCYRVTIWAPGKWVSHLAIRPWYQGFMRCMPFRPQGVPQGPNINPWDHYPPIELDPRWQVWHLPIPREWWFAFRVPDTRPRYITPYVTDNVVVSGV